ncbi:MAG: hypothetical protein GF353_15290 [Candidatus Lokiarchaeota archaeon]|nr:hypothetical protein [Candidatus Lokiarchaeota archaeon]
MKNNTYGFKLDHTDVQDNRFHAIYLVDSLTGSLLVNNKYSDKSKFNEVDDDLISSFLSAIDLFIKEIKFSEEEIQEINFKDTRILYEKKGRILCIGISKKTDLRGERKILRQIIVDFYDRFEQKITNFKGFISQDIINYKNRLKNMNFNSLINL